MIDLLKNIITFQKIKCLMIDLLKNIITFQKI